MRNKVINTSLLLLADAKDPSEYVKDDHALKGIQTKLAKSLIPIVKS